MKAFSHITGGGLLENIPRVLPNHLKVELDSSQWRVPPVFGWLARTGNVDEDEMARTFNCGIGGALIVNSKEVDEVLEMIQRNGETAWKIGFVKPCHQGGM